MENQKINKIIDNYLKLKLNINPIDNKEKIEISKSKEILLNHYTNEILKKVKKNFLITEEDTIEKIENSEKHRNKLKLSKFYLGCVYKDFYFSLLGFGTSVTCTLLEDENSKTTSELLKSKMKLMINEINKTTNIIEIIDLLEKFRNEIF